MTIEEMRKMAAVNDCEFIVDADGDICVRKKLWTEDYIGQRVQVRTYYPYPCEFLSPDKAEARLIEIAQNDAALRPGTRDAS